MAELCTCSKYDRKNVIPYLHVSDALCPWGVLLDGNPTFQAWLLYFEHIFLHKHDPISYIQELLKCTSACSPTWTLETSLKLLLQVCQFLVVVFGQ
jgi:hypothetical protein